MQKKYRDIHNWQVIIDQEPSAPKTVRNAWGLISAAFRFAELDVPAVRLPATPKAPIVFLSYDLGGWADAQTMHKHYVAIAEADLQKHADSMTDFFEKLP